MRTRTLFQRSLLVLGVGIRLSCMCQNDPPNSCVLDLLDSIPDLAFLLARTKVIIKSLFENSMDNRVLVHTQQGPLCLR